MANRIAIAMNELEALTRRFEADMHEALESLEVAANPTNTDLQRETNPLSGDDLKKAINENNNGLAEPMAQEQRDGNISGKIVQSDENQQHQPTAAQEGAKSLSAPSEKAEIDAEKIGKLKAFYNPTPTDDGVDDVTIREATCVACVDQLPFHMVARCPCSHEYCRQCLETMFIDTLTNQASWPPRCCGQPIPIEHYQICVFLSTEIIGQYLAKKLEMETPNRTYCHRPQCFKFIPPSRIDGGTGTCSTCEAETCIHCKEAAHDGGDCPGDEAEQSLRALAEQQGWKQCFACSHMVERTFGCNHMTCRCGAQFCYLCGASWEPRTCGCVVIDEQNLLIQQNHLDLIDDGDWDDGGWGDGGRAAERYFLGMGSGGATASSGGAERRSEKGWEPGSGVHTRSVETPGRAGGL